MRHIAYPLTSTARRALLILGLILAINEFGFVFFLSEGGPFHASEVMAYQIYDLSFVVNRTGLRVRADGRAPHHLAGDHGPAAPAAAPVTGVVADRCCRPLRDGRHRLLNVVLIVLSLLMLYPWLLAISTAIKAPGEASRNPGLIPEQIDLAKFIDVFREVDFPRLAFNSIVITGVTVVIVLLVASLAAYAFARLDFFLRDALFLFLLVGLMLQATALMIPLFQVNLALGLLDTHLAIDRAVRRARAALLGPHPARVLRLAAARARGGGPDGRRLTPAGSTGRSCCR